MSNPISMTPEQLKALLVDVVAIASKPNVLEQRKIDEEIEKDKRRAQAAIALAKAEAEKEYRRKHSCSHSRDAAGNPVSKGSPGSVWTTSGQLVGDDGLAVLICQRCCYTWQWLTSRQERDFIQNSEHGLLWFAPPADERCISQG